MITLRELATTLAALSFWRDEIAQDGNRSAHHYLKSVGMSGVKPLTPDEIERLSEKLRSIPVTD
jgi:hypothetical protein